MYIRVLSKQIPKVWESIKVAGVYAEDIKEKDRPLYLNNLLQSLLGGKTQCSVKLNDDRRIISLLLTGVMHHGISGDKYLYVQALYAWEPLDSALLNDYLHKMAKDAGCEYIAFTSNVPRMEELAQLYGYETMFKHYEARVK